MTGRLGWMPAAHFSSNDAQASPTSRALCSTFAAISGLNTFSSKCPLAPPIVTATSLPITCAATIVSASGCVGLTLPGMIEEPGSLSGMMSSPIPLRGPELKMRMSLPIFIRETASRFSAPDSSTIASCAASASNLFGAVTKGWPVSSAIFLATSTA